MVSTPYVLITAARNEAAFITKTIESVINQTVLPEKWIVVSNGSIDQTDDIVDRYAKKHTFIVLMQIKADERRNFASKTKAIETGYVQLKDIKYDFLGILDADISFGENYYEYILSQFRKKKKLGMAGGKIFDVYDGKSVEWITQLDRSVGGAIQMFRRQCYEDIGGLIPQEMGGEDAVAEFMARMHGWQVQTFPSMKVFHHRREGVATQDICRARFFQGVRDYLIGYHPIFEVAKCLRRVVERPYVLGSLLWISGYFFACFGGYKRTLPSEVVKYIRKDQTHFLLRSLVNLVKRKDAQ